MIRLVDTLDFLLGSWTVERAIDDRRSALSGSFAGRATLLNTAVDGSGRPVRARYEETGELRFGAYQGPARRALDYVRGAAGSVSLRFSDGRPFVDIDLGSGAWQGTHPCREDRYQLRLVVRSPDVVEEYWWVRGPETDYDAFTTLTRSAPA